MKFHRFGTSCTGHQCIRINHVSLQVTSGKNEVVMEFHMSEESQLSLVEMRFHVPNSTVPVTEDEEADQENSGPDPVKELHDKILAKADVIQATGDAIVTFSEIHCLTPRLPYLSCFSLVSMSSI